MAGRSYASNLSGLLNSMAGTIGSMGEGGNRYVETFRRSQAPDVDMSDSASLLGYADWARRNGYDDEAKQYMALGYEQKEIEKQEAKDATRAKAVSNATSAYTAGSAGASSGDPLQLKYNIDSLKTQIQQAAKAGDLDLVNQLRADVGKLAAMEPAAIEGKTIKQAQAIPQYEATLAAMSPDDPRRAGLQKAIDFLKNNPAVAEAYKTMQAQDLALEKAGLTVEGLKYEQTRRPFEEQADALALEIQGYTLAAKQNAAFEEQELRQARNVAAANIASGQYTLSEEQISQMSGTAQAEARKIMGDEFERRADMEEALSGGTVGTSTYAAAEVLAENHPQIATALQNYKETKERSMTVGDQRRAAAALTNAVHVVQKDNADKARSTNLEAAVGGQMKALMALGESESTWLDGADDFVEVMSDPEAYIDMRKDIALLAADRGISPDQLTAEMTLELMSIAAEASDRDDWVAANDRAAAKRRAVKKQWQDAVNEPKKEWVSSVVKENSGKTQWNDAELEEFATEHYETAVQNLQTLLILPNTHEQELWLRMQMNTKADSMFRPREFGPPGNRMALPPVFDQESFEAMLYTVQQGVRITYQNFVPPEED